MHSVQTTLLVCGSRNPTPSGSGLPHFAHLWLYEAFAEELLTEDRSRRSFIWSFDSALPVSALVLYVSNCAPQSRQTDAVPFPHLKPMYSTVPPQLGQS